MKKIYFSLFLAISSLQSHSDCLTTKTTDPVVGTITVHTPRRASCSCRCTAARNTNGTCRECGHKREDRSQIVVDTQKKSVPSTTAKQFNPAESIANIVHMITHGCTKKTTTQE